MNLRTAFKSPMAFHVIVGAFIIAYLLLGVNAQLALIERRPLSVSLMLDFGFYEKALSRALSGGDPYAVRSVGTGYLYPPPALLVVELFSHIEPFLLKALVYIIVNVGLLSSIVYGTAKRFGYSMQAAWFWFPLSLGFAPFLTLLLIGQINVITLFGIFLMLYYERKSPLLSGLGLGLAIVTKVTPLLLFAYLIVNKSYKVIGAAVGALLVLTLLSVIRYGIQPVLTYPDLFFWLLQQFPMGANSQSLAAQFVVADLGQFHNEISRFPAFLRTPIELFFTFTTSHYVSIHRILTAYIFLVIAASGLLACFGKQPGEPLFIVTTLGMAFAPNVMWHHHYVFLLLPLLVWMGWSRLKIPVVAWCLMGLAIIQAARFFPPHYALFVHVFGHLSLLAVLTWQWRHFQARRNHPNLPVT